ncbi:MAG TPA: alpha-amylase family glycosyl hydrolase, partial [Chloroflexota bacterium]|nr:alpha-amylase family glycosyl hydrolase [Chloroflexota bacterium]
TCVDPLFGTLPEFDQLLAAAHRRGLRVLLDLVPNHTSDEHPWFVESRRGRSDPKRDWYIWRDPKPGGGPPNNWLSHFGGSAWTYDRATRQYYLHLFDPKQPDLNWANRAVRNAVYDAMRFWLDRGVDGFRVDVVGGMVKDPQFRDDPPNPDWKRGDPAPHKLLRVHSMNRPGVHAVVREMRRVTDAYQDRVLIGEYYGPFERLVRFYGRHHGGRLDGCHLPFNFALIALPWDAAAVRAAVDRYEASLPEGAWPSWVLGNHDRPRVASRVGADQARVAQMLLLTLRGTPTMYYGDEIGMADVPVPHQRALDPVEKRVPGHGRDPARTPMQWSADRYAGFSAHRPWLPLARDYAAVNVAAQRRDPRSLLSLVRRLLQLRRATPALALGDIATLESGHDDVLAYARTCGGQRVLVALNFGPHKRCVDFLAAGGRHRVGTILCSTSMGRTGAADLASLQLRPNEGVVLGA